MSLTLEEYREMAQLAQELGDIDAELEAREGMEYLQSLSSQQSEPENTSEALDEKPDEPKSLPLGNDPIGVAEGVLSVASPITGKIAGGLAGLGTFLGEQIDWADEGKSAEVVKAVQDYMRYEPKTQAGKKKIQDFTSSAPIKAIASAAKSYGDFIDENYIDPIVDDQPGLAAYRKGMLVGVPETMLTLLGVRGLKTGVDATFDVTKKAADITRQGIEETVNRVAGKPITIVDDAGLITPEAKDFLLQARANGVDVDSPTKKVINDNYDLQGLIPDKSTPEIGQMIDNYNSFKKREVPPTKANLTQSPDDWRSQQDYLKSGGDVNDIVINQDRRLADLARDGKAQIGPVETEIVGVNQSLFDTVANIAETYDNAVTTAYKAAKDSAPKSKKIKLDGLVEDLRKSAGDENLSGGVVSSVKGELKNRGVIDNDWSVTGKIDVETAEKIRQKLNQIYANNSTSGLGKDIVFNLKESLDSDVAKFFDDDIFLDARRAKKDFHKIISRDKATKWEKNSESLVNKILTSKIDGNKIFNEILKAKPQDFSDLKNFYLERTGDAGINAWNNLKGQIFQQALDKATSGAQRGAKTGEAVPIFNGRQFENVFKPLKTSRATLEKGNSDNKFTSIFSKAEQELIGDIIEITKLRKPNPSNPQGSGPSGFALNRAVKGLINSAIDKAPVIGSYVEKRQVNKAIDIEKKAESDFANPEPITKNQKKYINRERRN